MHDVTDGPVSFSSLEDEVAGVVAVAMRVGQDDLRAVGEVAGAETNGAGHNGLRHGLGRHPEGSGLSRKVKLS